VKHPLRDIGIAVFQCVEGEGPRFIAKFEPFNGYPIFFTGDTADAARQQARDFADDAVTKHEAAFIARQEGLVKARAQRSLRGIS
jgi:hypothetical protein